MKYPSCSLQIGYAIMRTGLGIVLLVSGYNKLSHALTVNTEQLMSIGSTMSFFGISSGYLLWGYIAASTEFFGGLALISNFFVRLTAIPLVWLFIVALTFHLQKNDPFTVWGFAFLCLTVAVGLLCGGSGNCTTHETMHRNQ